MTLMNACGAARPKSRRGGKPVLYGPPKKLSKMTQTPRTEISDGRGRAAEAPAPH